MIMALLAAYLLGGGGDITGNALTSATVERVAKRAKTIIDDPARSASAQQTLTELRKQMQSFEKTFAKRGKQLDNAYKDRSASPDQAFALLDALNEDWEVSQGRVLDLRFKLRDRLTEQEWTDLFASKS